MPPSQPARVHYAGFKEGPGRPGGPQRNPPPLSPQIHSWPWESFISREISRLIALAHSIEYSPPAPWAWSHREGLYHLVGLQSDGGDIKYRKNHETVAPRIPGTQGFSCCACGSERNGGFRSKGGGWCSEAHTAVQSGSRSFVWRVLLARRPGTIHLLL